MEAAFEHLRSAVEREVEERNAGRKAELDRREQALNEREGEVARRERVLAEQETAQCQPSAGSTQPAAAPVLNVVTEQQTAPPQCAVPASAANAQPAQGQKVSPENEQQHIPPAVAAEAEGALAQQERKASLVAVSGDPESDEEQSANGVKPGVAASGVVAGAPRSRSASPAPAPKTVAGGSSASPAAVAKTGYGGAAPAHQKSGQGFFEKVEAPVAPATILNVAPEAWPDLGGGGLGKVRAPSAKAKTGWAPKTSISPKVVG